MSMTSARSVVVARHNNIDTAWPVPRSAGRPGAARPTRTRPLDRPAPSVWASENGRAPRVCVPRSRQTSDDEQNDDDDRDKDRDGPQARRRCHASSDAQSLFRFQPGAQCVLKLPQTGVWYSQRRPSDKLTGSPRLRPTPCRSTASSPHRPLSFFSHFHPRSFPRRCRHCASQTLSQKDIFSRPSEAIRRKNRGAGVGRCARKRSSGPDVHECSRRPR